MGYLTDGLSFNTLRQANVNRLPEFKNAKGEKAHDKDGADWSLNDWMTALTGEVGETANILKKIRRGDFELEEVREKLADEMADIQTYLDILAFRCGIDLGKATIEKFNKKSAETGCRIRIRPHGDDWFIMADPNE